MADGHIRIVQRGVVVQRVVNGVAKNVRPKIGQPFEFTAEEIGQLEAHPGHVRHPRNETAGPLPALPVGPTENIDKAAKPVQDTIPPVNTGRSVDVGRAPPLGAARLATGVANRPGVPNDVSGL